MGAGNLTLDGKGINAPRDFRQPVGSIPCRAEGDIDLDVLQAEALLIWNLVKRPVRVDESECELTALRQHRGQLRRRLR